MVEVLYTTAKTLAAIFVMSLIVPLIVWGGSGSWRRALEALRGWWLIVGALFAIGGGAGLLAVLMEAIG